MKILYITAYPLEYYSSANIRNWGLVEALKANGHKVYTLSPYPSDREMFSGIINMDSFEERYWIGNIANKDAKQMATNNKWKHKIKKICFVIFNYISVYDRRIFYTRFIDSNLIKEKFDIIISSSDPKSSHLFAKKLIIQQPSICKKWVQYWGDPFSNDISNNKVFGNLFVKMAENKILKCADKIVYVSPFTKDEIAKKYPKYSDKIFFYPIPYRLSAKYANPLQSRRLTIGYFGDYNSTNRNIIPLYEALKKGNYYANIIGNSNLHLEQTDRIKISHRIPTEELKSVIDNTNIFICICNLHGTQIPGKIYHYVNSMRPIIIILDGDKQKELQNYFESFNRFYMCDNSSDSINFCINKVINENKQFKVPDMLSPTSIAEDLIK